jgi:hypothetical protein
MTDDILDDPFHFCALRAYMEIYAQTRRFPPDPEATRRLAYQYYEQGLAEKNRCKQPVDIGRTPPREAGQGCEAPEGGGGTVSAHHLADHYVLTDASFVQGDG